MTQPNSSTAHARVIADELHRHGVDYAVISPGSRSAALAIAFDEHPAIETRVILDERSASFHALGRSRISGAPVVALCTSGTALANFMPAVVEADLSLIPVILISADRPPDMLHVGANQTIDQVRIFGDKTRWFCNLAPAEPSRDSNSYWRSSVSQAVARALGHGGRPGPVHLNIAFREPTVPVGDDGRSKAQPYPYPIEGRPGGGRWQDHRRAPAGPGVLPPGIAGERSLLLVGEGDFDRTDLKRAADRLGWPVLGTAVSDLRGTDVITTYHHLLVEGVPGLLRPDVVVTVGRVGPSDRLGSLTVLDGAQVHIDRWGSWNDPRRHSTLLVEGDPAKTLDAIEPASSTDFRSAWIDADAAMRSALDQSLVESQVPTGPSVARALSTVDFDLLVTASSMPVRDIDAHTVHGARTIANRGASGIDGFASTALGAASAGGRTIAFAGDLSFLHDSGGLVIDRLGDVVFLIVDNGGGGLFDLLPQAEHAPGYERLFVTPHGLDLPVLTAAYGLGASVVDRIDALAGRLSKLLGSGGPHAVIVPVDRETDLKQRRALDDAARLVMSDLS